MTTAAIIVAAGRGLRAVNRAAYSVQFHPEASEAVFARVWHGDLAHRAANYRPNPDGAKVITNFVRHAAARAAMPAR